MVRLRRLVESAARPPTASLEESNGANADAGALVHAHGWKSMQAAGRVNGAATGRRVGPPEKEGGTGAEAPVPGRILKREDVL